MSAQPLGTRNLRWTCNTTISVHFICSFPQACGHEHASSNPGYPYQCIVAQIRVLLAFSRRQSPVGVFFHPDFTWEEAVTSQILSVLRLSYLLLVIAALVGCSPTTSEDQRRRDEKTREEAAKVTERIKPELKEAGKELGQAAREAAEDARAAAQGVKEGWNRDHRHPLNLNSATESDLENLPGITKTDAEKIVRGRPYRSKNELLTKRILSEPDYDQIRDYVTTD